MQICRTAKEKVIFHHEGHEERKGNLQSCAGLDRSRMVRQSASFSGHTASSLRVLCALCGKSRRPAEKGKSFFTTKHTKSAKEICRVAGLDRLRMVCQSASFSGHTASSLRLLCVLCGKSRLPLKRESHFSPPSTRRAQGRLCSCNDRLQLKPNSLDSATIRQMPLFQPSNTLCSSW